VIIFAVNDSNFHGGKADKASVDKILLATMIYCDDANQSRDLYIKKTLEKTIEQRYE
jgi:hypothetical protein